MPGLGSILRPRGPFRTTKRRRQEGVLALSDTQEDRLNDPQFAQFHEAGCAESSHVPSLDGDRRLMMQHPERA